MNTAVSGQIGIPKEKVEDLADYENSEHFSHVEKDVLKYADTITKNAKTVTDEMVKHLRKHFSDDQIVELTSIIAWENFVTKFNDALNVPSQGFTNKV